MRRIFFWIAVFSAVFLQGTVTTLPIVLWILLVGYVIKKEAWLFPVAFFAGIILDIVAVRPLGQTSLFFMIFLTLVMLYERKFETTTYHFITFASFVGSYVFLWMFSSTHIFFQAVISCLFCLFAFRLATVLSSSRA